VIAGVDDQDVAALDGDAGLLLPGLEVLGAVDLVVADAHAGEVHDARRADQLVDRNAGDVRTGIVEVDRRVEMGGDVIGGGDVLRVDALESEPLHPLDRRPLVEREGRRVHGEVLRQVEDLHLREIVGNEHRTPLRRIRSKPTIRCSPRRRRRGRGAAPAARPRLAARGAREVRGAYNGRIMRVAARLVPVLALVAAWPATADIRDLSATLPEAATWHDPLIANFAGESNCLVELLGASNIELTVKVLDGCGLNDRFWVFLASGSTVQYTLTVTDTDKGASWTSSHAAGTLPALIADTTALPSCP
jgi:hypothetical protein